MIIACILSVLLFLWALGVWCENVWAFITIITLEGKSLRLPKYAEFCCTCLMLDINISPEFLCWALPTPSSLGYPKLGWTGISQTGINWDIPNWDEVGVCSSAVFLQKWRWNLHLSFPTPCEHSAATRVRTAALQLQAWTSCWKSERNCWEGRTSSGCQRCLDSAKLYWRMSCLYFSVLRCSIFCLLRLTGLKMNDFSSVMMDTFPRHIVA